MKVCMFIRSLPVHSMGGLETYTWNLAKGLTQRGLKVTLLTSEHPKGIKHEIIDEHLDIYYCGKREKEYYSGSYLKESAELFRKLNDELHFNIIHSQSDGARGLVLYDIKYDTPMIQTVHGYWYNSYKNSFRRRTFRTILSGLIAYYQMRISKKIYKRHLGWFQQFQKNFVINDSSFEGYRHDFPQIKETLVKLYTGIDIHKFQPYDVTEMKKKMHLESNQILLYSGRLDRIKGIQYFLPFIPNIVSSFPNLKFLIIGEGDYRIPLENIVKRLKIEKYVQFLGFIPNDELPYYLNLADIYLFPVVGYEGLPLNCIESISCGIPVIATKTDGVTDIVKHGINGYLVDYRKKRQFITYICQILSNQNLKTIMSKNARDIALKLFDFQKMVDLTINTYNEVINNYKIHMKTETDG